jgi:GT2 family glycosyltransferase
VRIAMNEVLILTRNCLEMTKRCVESVRGQDIPTTVHIIDNGSTDGTPEWITANKCGFDTGYHFMRNEGVSVGWNFQLGLLFEGADAEHVLVLNNDTELPSYFYRKLLSYDLPFVTGISVDEPKDHPDSWQQPAESPDFSAFLIRRDAWEKVGRFDERMKLYASDCDWCVRAYRAGIKPMNSGVPFRHERSSTLRHAPPADRAAIEKQADADRRVFKEKWGCFPWEPEYSKLFQ